MVETIELRELRDLVNKLFDRLEHRGAKQYPIAQDAFWQTWFEDAFDLDAMPAPALSSVADSLADVRAEAADPDSASDWHAFFHLSGLFCFLAYAADGRATDGDV